MTSHDAIQNLIFGIIGSILAGMILFGAKELYDLGKIVSGIAVRLDNIGAFGTKWEDVRKSTFHWRESVASRLATLEEKLKAIEDRQHNHL